MTLDEARTCLGVTAGASVEEIREAFRRAARAVHPDRHPAADAARRASLGLEFDRAREARDILVRYTSDPLRTPAQPPAEATPTAHQTRRGARASRPAAPRRETTAPPQRVTLRFDEFIAWTDAAGFRDGVRSRPYVDWTRLTVWSLLGLLVAAVVGGGVVLSVSV